MVGSADAERLAIEDLKVATLAQGVRASEADLVALEEAFHLTTHEYPTTGGIACRVGDVYLNAPFDEWYCADADAQLVVDHGRVRLRHAGHDFVVDEIFPVPGYVGAVDAEGRRYDDVAFSHLDRVRLSPIVGCAHDCAFCDLPGRIHLRPLDQLIAAGEHALADPILPIRHLLVSGGSPGPRHRAPFADTVEALVEHFDGQVEVDVMMSSGPDTVELVDRLVDAGVHGLALNMELHSDPASEVHLRSKHHRARPHWADTVARAVDRLGPGRVRSLIIPGLEPVSATIAGVEEIASLGADPVLSPFRPARGTALARHEPASVDLLREVLDRAREIVARHGVSLGPRCLPCQHNTLAFPWDVPRAA